VWWAKSDIDFVRVFFYSFLGTVRSRKRRDRWYINRMEGTGGAGCMTKICARARSVAEEVRETWVAVFANPMRDTRSLETIA